MIPDIEPVNTWKGNNSTTRFDFDFLINNASELKVLHTNSSGEQKLLVLNTDYTINQIAQENGSYITFPILGSSYNVLGSNEKLSLILDIPVAQTSPYGTSSKLNLKSIEYSLDYLTRLIQIQKRLTERSLKIQEGADISTDILAANLNKVAEISTDVSTVAESIAIINAVVADLTTINSVAADLTNIDNVLTYADLAKDWAIKEDGKVFGEDYSSKYWAEKSKEAKENAIIYSQNAENSATLAEEYVATVRQTATEIEHAAVSGLASISTATTDATNSISISTTAGLGSITTATTSATTAALGSISATTTSGVGSINDAKTSALNTISGSKTEALSILSATTTANIGSINSAKTDVLTTIDGAKTEALSTINTTGTNYINQMNTIKEQATTASNYSNIWAEGTDIEVQALGGVHSSKGWAEISNINNSHALKSYSDNGELLTDAEGLADVKSYAHSTFDLSKFSVVGSPTITDDGIVSGLDKDNYLGIVINWDTTKSWEVRGKFVTPTSGSAEAMLVSTNAGTGMLLQLNTRVFNVPILRLLLGSVSNSWNITGGSAGAALNWNTTYYYIFKYTGTNYIIQISTDGENYTDYITVNNSTAIYPSFGSIRIGSWSAYGDLSDMKVDLKQFSITVDGVEVFSGNQTGVDIIKPDDYTVVGTPTISVDGAASGFSGSNCIRCVNITELVYQANNWEIDTKFTTNTIGTVQTIIGDASEGGVWKPQYQIKDNGKLKLYLSTEYGGWQIQLYGATTLLANTTYYTKIIFNGSKYQLFISTDNVNFVLDAEVINSTKIRNTNYLSNLGVDTFSNGALLVPFLGSIDLNAFKIYVDGNLVYQPCLKIPYTESKTGSKIVQSVYRDRVNDMYEQFGYAPYYTLSDTDFTLPQGELYGMYEKYRQQILDDMMPDYANGISITVSDGTYTAPSDGYFYFQVWGGTSGGMSSLKINNIDVIPSATVGGDGEYRNTFSYLVSKGDVITWITTGDTSVFYPMKGAN